MQSPTLITESQDAVRHVVYKVEVKWAAGWVDETSRVLDITLHASIKPTIVGFWALGAVGDRSAQIEVRNEGQRFNPLNAGGVVGSSGGEDREIRIWCGFKAGNAPGGADQLVRKFTGFVEEVKLSQDGLSATIIASTVMARLDRIRATTDLVLNARSSVYASQILGLAGFAVGSQIEPGDRMLPGAWMDNETIREELEEIQQAEGGWTFVDELGNVVIWNNTHFIRSNADPLLDPTVSQFTFSRGMMRLWDRSVLRKERRNRVSLLVTTRELRALSVVYSQPGTAIRLEPGETRDFGIRYQDPVYSPLAPERETDYIAVTAGNRIAGAGDLTLTQVEQSAQRGKLRATNNLSNEPLTLVKLQQRGYPFEATAQHEIFAEASAPGGTADRDLELKPIAYLGDVLSGQAVADRSVAVLNRAPVVAKMRARAVPSLQLGDRVTCQVITGWSGGLPELGTEDYFVVSMTERVNRRNGYELEAELALASQMFPQSSYAALKSSGGTPYGSTPVFW